MHAIRHDSHSHSSAGCAEEPETAPAAAAEKEEKAKAVEKTLSKKVCAGSAFLLEHLAVRACGRVMGSTVAERDKKSSTRALAESGAARVGKIIHRCGRSRWRLDILNWCSGSERHILSSVLAYLAVERQGRQPSWSRAERMTRCSCPSQ